jgi:hypothetical protein
MIDRSSQIIDPIADDSWAVDCLPLMPTFRARVQREQEARRRAEQERIDEANRAAAEERRLYFEKQQNAAKLEREKQQKLRKQETDRARAARANENRTLSPTSSRAVAKRKSGSSIGGSGSGGEVEKMVAPKGSQRKGSRKGKGKEPKDVGSMDPSELRDPPELPAGLFSVSKIFVRSLVVLIIFCRRRRTPVIVVRHSRLPSAASSLSSLASASNANMTSRNAYSAAPMQRHRSRSSPESRPSSRQSNRLVL